MTSTMLMTRRTRGNAGGTTVTGHTDMTGLPRKPHTSAAARRTIKHREAQAVRREVAAQLAAAR